MAVYLVLDIDVTDPVGYQEYVRLSGPAMARHGGRFLVRGGATQVIEGDWQPKRLVVVEFDDEEHFRRFYYSEDYQAALKIRQAHSKGNVVLAQGYSSPQ